MTKEHEAYALAFSLIAKSLRDFGYPSVTAEQVADVYNAMKANQPLPHGIIGKFAASQLKDLIR